MIDYYGALKTTIATGEYLLSDMEDRIDRCWIDTRITEAQRDELRQLAAEAARDEYQIDVLGQLSELERRVFALEHPTDQYVIWTAGYQTAQHEIVRYDVTGDGELDLCRYDGGRASTSLSIGKIDGWHLLDIELENVATITRDEDGGYVITPINAEEGEPETEPDAEGGE